MVHAPAELPATLRPRCAPECPTPVASLAWWSAHDLTLPEAEELLDWLEAHRVERPEVFLAAGGKIGVRWQA